MLSNLILTAALLLASCLAVALALTIPVIGGGLAILGSYHLARELAVVATEAY